MGEMKIIRPKILIIEDDEFLSSMYITKFTKEGFEVIFGEDGAIGLKKAKEEKPNLILLDILLPKMDGFEVLKALKEDGTTAVIPVILLTNLSERDHVKKGIELGAIDYLVKAYNIPAEVVLKVKERLQLK